MPKIRTPAACPSVLTSSDSFTFPPSRFPLHVSPFTFPMIAFRDMPDQETPGAIHGGSHWAPRGVNVEDYAQIVASDVNDAWYPPAPAVLQAIARWSRHS